MFSSLAKCDASGPRWNLSTAPAMWPIPMVGEEHFGFGLNPKVSGSAYVFLARFKTSVISAARSCVSLFGSSKSTAMEFLIWDRPWPDACWNASWEKSISAMGPNLSANQSREKFRSANADGAKSLKVSKQCLHPHRLRQVRIRS